MSSVDFAERMRDVEMQRQNSVPCFVYTVSHGTGRNLGTVGYLHSQAE